MQRFARLIHYTYFRSITNTTVAAVITVATVATFKCACTALCRAGPFRAVSSWTVPHRTALFRTVPHLSQIMVKLQVKALLLFGGSCPIIQ